jgi:sugar/nucleoside kinase (ribokinase family)
LVILADFGHYFITKKIIKFLENSDKFLAVNIQTNSLNFGFNTINKIKKVNYLSIDERELQLAFHSKKENKKLIKQLYKKLDIDYFSLTLGKKGSLNSDKNNIIKIPSFFDKTIDTIGAGDAYLALSSLMIYKTKDIQLSGFIGNITGGLATQYIGNDKNISKIDLIKSINGVMK